MPAEAPFLLPGLWTGAVWAMGLADEGQRAIGGAQRDFNILTALLVVLAAFQA